MSRKSGDRFSEEDMRHSSEVATLDRVLETCLYVDDLDRAARFYEDVLGLAALTSDAHGGNPGNGLHGGVTDWAPNDSLYFIAADARWPYPQGGIFWWTGNGAPGSRGFRAGRPRFLDAGVRTGRSA